MDYNETTLISPCHSDCITVPEWCHWHWADKHWEVADKCLAGHQLLPLQLLPESHKNMGFNTTTFHPLIHCITARSRFQKCSIRCGTLQFIKNLIYVIHTSDKNSKPFSRFRIYKQKQKLIEILSSESICGEGNRINISDQKPVNKTGKNKIKLVLIT